MISNSGSDERKKYSGGKAGDQTGNEWNIIPWYNRPWNVVLRHPSEKVRKEIALLGKLAANNNSIGYDQGERWTYWDQLKINNYDPSKIKNPCEADCSAGVLANVKAVGYRLNVQKLKDINQNGYTGNQRKILKNAGFEVLTDKKYLTSDAYLLEGDIPLYEGHHTCINLTNGKYSGVANSEANSDTVLAPKQTGNVSRGQAWLNSNYGTLIKSATSKLLEVDNDYGTHSRWAALAVWKDMVNRKVLFDKNKLDVTNKNFGERCQTLAKKVVIKKGTPSGTYIYLLQFLLSAKGFYDGAMNAMWNDKLEFALKEFQRSVNITDDGKCGAMTWYRLFN